MTSLSIMYKVWVQYHEHFEYGKVTELRVDDDPRAHRVCVLFYLLPSTVVVLLQRCE
jgi:hypothetical protein